jgi:hypothetical protein
MLTRFVGDIHGDFDMMHVFENTNTPIVQLGDFNLYGYGVWYNFNVEKEDLFSGCNSYGFQTPVHFIDGNHEDFAHPRILPDAKSIQQIRNNLFYIPRGFVSGNVLFVGGADSIDKKIRKEGLNWFPEERISKEQIYRIIEGTKQRIEVIVSHECPFGFINSKLNVHRKDSVFMMQDLFRFFEPKLWIFGHYHRTFNEMFQGCRMIGVNKGEHIDIDVPVGNELLVPAE